MEKLSLGMATNDGECNKRHCTKVNNEWKAAERKLSFALSPSQSLHSVKLLVRPCSAYFLIVGLQSGITSVNKPDQDMEIDGQETKEIGGVTNRKWYS